jgi:hypothetical protein
MHVGPHCAGRESGVWGGEAALGRAGAGLGFCPCHPGAQGLAGVAGLPFCPKPGTGMLLFLCPVSPAVSQDLERARCILPSRLLFEKPSQNPPTEM